MAKTDKYLSFVSPDGTNWGVEIRLPGASSALAVFHHPDGSTARRNRYAWIQWHGAEARNVTARIKPRAVMRELDDAELALLFRRSMAIGTSSFPAFSPA